MNCKFFTIVFWMWVFLHALPGRAQAQSCQPLVDWEFHPHYTLSGHAANYPGKQVVQPQSGFERVKMLGNPIVFYGMYPTQRITDIEAPPLMIDQAFTVNLSFLHHVNTPVGAIIRSTTDQNQQDFWLVGIYDKEIIFQLHSHQFGVQEIVSDVPQGYKKYWRQILAVKDDDAIRLYINGELVASKSLPDHATFTFGKRMEVAGYFENEPFMKVDNLFKRLSVYDCALQGADAKRSFQNLKEQVDRGALFENTFHFSAGPYLHLATQNSMNIIWETDRPTRSIVRYGTGIPLTDSVETDSVDFIHEVTIPDLDPQTLYYYEVASIDGRDSVCSSGILTFNTAVESSSPVSFCILGDTESRPHINQQLGNEIWEERPNFILHLGDITDGGMLGHKFQWNHEYFTGITPVASRIPVFPVPGNGEGDLFWYKKYHRLPGDEAYYQFSYGNMDFFMLNSNDNPSLKKGGEQYAWLEQALKESSAEWKIVAHHHCPVSSDEDDFGNTWQGRKSTEGDPKFDDLKELYETNDIDVVFYGHVHAYERSWPLVDGRVDEDGVVYVQSGGGGGNLEDFVPYHAAFSNRVQRGHHYCRVDVNGSTLYFKMFDLEGKLLDFFEIEK